MGYNIIALLAELGVYFILYVGIYYYTCPSRQFISIILLIREYGGVSQKQITDF